MAFIFIILFCLSLVLAVRSMRDFEIPSEIRQLLRSRKIHGTIVFMKDKVLHYSSTSSSDAGSR